MNSKFLLVSFSFSNSQVVKRREERQPRPVDFAAVPYMQESEIPESSEPPNSLVCDSAATREKH